MPANPWDYSQILLSNQAGAHWARGIEQVGRAFGKGIEAYYERKQKTEKEDATVDWLNQNEGAVNQLFPQLAQVKDPAERRKVIKAGIKGAGLENLVQVQQFMETQRRQKDMDAINREMMQTQIATMRQGQENTQALMDERATEGKAIRAAADPNAGMVDQIMRGRRFEELDPAAEADRAEVYMRSGGRSPQMIAALVKERPFSPAEMMTPSGLNMVQTSPKSFMPDPRVGGKPTKASAYPHGPEYSKDKKFYRSGPDDSWKPVKSGEGKLDAVQAAELNALPDEITKLEQKLVEASNQIRKGNRKPGPDWLPGINSYEEAAIELNAELRAKKRRLKELSQLSSSEQQGDTDEDFDTTPSAIADPFAFVLGGN